MTLVTGIKDTHTGAGSTRILIETDRSSNRKDILDWVSQDWNVENGPTSSRNKTVARESGTWILDDPQLQSWLRRETDPIFWLVGRMGVGKTVLVSTIIQALIDSDYCRDGTLLAYFYLDGKSRHLSGTSTMLRSLLRQLAVYEPCFKSLESLWSKTPKPLLDNYTVLEEIRKVVSSTPTIILLDGLDEAQQGYQVAEGLSKLAHNFPRQKTTFLKLLVSGREPQTTPLGLSIAETLNLESAVARKHIVSDIGRYIDLRVSASFYGQSGHLQKLIKDWLKSKANNVFRWVELAIDYLGECLDIEDALNNTPPRIEETYQEMFDQIQKGDASRRQIAHRTFIWLCSTLDKVSNQETVKAISWDLKREPTLQEVRTACRNFVNIGNCSETFEFSHVSAFDFVRKQNLRWNESGLKTWQPASSNSSQEQLQAEHHVAMACNCLTRLCSPNVPKSRPQAIPSQRIAFRRYCYVYWASHFARADEPHIEGSARLRHLLATFIRQEYCIWQIALTHILKNWLSTSQCQNPVMTMWQDTIFRDTPQADLLLLGCVFGIEAIISECLRYRFPFVAIEQGRCASYTDVQSSIAEVTATLNNRRLTTMSRALYLAAKWGHPKLIQLLLKYRPLDDENELEDGQSAFHLAISSGSLDATKCLISAVARESLDVAVQSHLTPVGFAIEVGNIEILKLLIESGATIDTACSPDGILPIHKAARDNQEEILDYLLQLSPDDLDLPAPDRRDRFRALIPGSTPLIVAAENGSVACVKHLLQKGADLQAKRDDGTGALQAAVRQGSTDITALVLKAGMTASTPCLELDESLLIAAKHRRTRIILLLIRAGASDSARDADGKTALTLAVGNAHPESVACLLENGADANEVDASNKSPLSIMLETKNMRFFDRYLITELLLKYKASSDIAFQSTSSADRLLLGLFDNKQTVAETHRMITEEVSRVHQDGSHVHKLDSFDWGDDCRELSRWSRVRATGDSEEPQQQGKSRTNVWPLFYFTQTTNSTMLWSRGSTVAYRHLRLWSQIADKTWTPPLLKQSSREGFDSRHDDNDQRGLPVKFSSRTLLHEDLPLRNRETTAATH